MRVFHHAWDHLKHVYLSSHSPRVAREALEAATLAPARRHALIPLFLTFDVSPDGVLASFCRWVFSPFVHGSTLTFRFAAQGYPHRLLSLFHPYFTLV